MPESGDSVQAMKAGLMEVADMFVVNKADRDGAHALMAELRFAVHLHYASGTTAKDMDWEIPVLAAQAADDVGIAEIWRGPAPPRAARAGGRAREAPPGPAASGAQALLAEELAAEVMARVQADPELSRVTEEVAGGSLDVYSGVAEILAHTLRRP